MSTTTTNVRLLKNVMIPMRDGIHLAARIFLPDASEPVPAVVNMMPYHKDGTYSVGYLDAVNRDLAAHGYATITADLRGVGNSEGTAPHAFAAAERLDGYDLVEWVAGQPWCQGTVGMWGLSYGGITALSTASARPPSLKAIIAIHAATDLYWDYLQSKGCRVAFSPDVHWGIRMAASNLLPPLFGDQDVNWDKLWRERLQHYRPWIVDWHEKMFSDDFWQDAVTHPEQIDAATYLVGGWRDIFADVNFRVFEQLNAPKRLLVGPWKHTFPDLAATAPIGFLPEMRRWWDRWLKGLRNGLEDEPSIVHYVYNAEEWRYERQWPPAHGSRSTFAMTSQGSLVNDADASIETKTAITYEYTPLVGADTVAMHWLPGPDTPQYPPSDDALSVCFDTASHEEVCEIVGTAIVHLNLSATLPEPPLVARLFHITPNGQRQLITLGWMKGRGVDPGTPENELQPGAVYQVQLPLRPIAYRVPAGGSLRLTLSCADLSRIWPETHSFSLKIHPSSLELPIVSGPDSAVPAPQMSSPTMIPSPRIANRQRQLHLRRDLNEPVVRLEAATGQIYQLDEGATLDTDLQGTLTVDGVRPWRSSLQAQATFTLERPSDTVRTAASMVETARQLWVTASVTVDGQSVYHNSWNVPLEGAHTADGSLVDPVALVREAGPESVNE